LWRLGANAGGFAVADVLDSGCWAGVLDEDFSVEVGDGEVVAVGDDQDVLEAEVSADSVVDAVEPECADAGQSLQ
jgi:hypothetical protein